MLDNQEFATWCHELSLSEQARTTIMGIRSSAPARRVGGGRNNVSGRYPSRKMGVTIQFESHRVELAAVHEMEHDPDVLEYYDQPPSILLEYEARNGRRLAVAHTPDYFMICRNGAGWQECKTEEELGKLAQQSPNRYCRREEQWCCPPGEHYAGGLGLSYRVRSSSETSWVYQRNLQFLEDYFRFDSCSADKEACQTILTLLRVQQPMTLSDLLGQVLQIQTTPDDLYGLIAHGEIYVDLHAAPLVEPRRVQVFLDRQAAMANTVDAPAHQPAMSSGPIHVVVGTAVVWDSRVWTVVTVGRTMIEFLGDDNAFTGLPLETFEELVRNGRISSSPVDRANGLSSAAKNLLNEASEKDFRKANRRAAIVCSYLKAEPLPQDSVNQRTLRFFVAQYKKAKEAYGCGYVGLLPRDHRKGNRNRKLPEATYQLTVDFIEREYEAIKQKTKYGVYSALLLACQERSVTPPSYKTFIKLIRQRPRYEQTLKRQGKRAAYRYEPFYWELEQTTPRHGDRPFEIGHIDHTELDIELRCSQTGRNLGRPWLSLLTDAFSRRELAVYLTYDSPSYRSVMMVLRECVRRHGRLPQILVVDGGPEFRSTYFETLLARYECTQKVRPPARARFGSVCERLFGTVNTQLIHNLIGNTQLMRNVRQVTQSVNPRNLAVWTLESLSKRICEWAYDVYEMTEHPALGQSPREAFQVGLAQGGFRPHRLIPYDDDFRVLTLPTTSKGTATVFPGRGIKMRGLYYWCDSFRDPAIERSVVPVRYDPWDAGTAYAYVRNQWVRCHSEYFVAFQGRTQKELMIATAELRRRQSLHSKALAVSAKTLATFLKSVESEEVLLTQRLMDHETRRASGFPAGASHTLIPTAKEENPVDDHPVQTLSCAPASPNPTTNLDLLEEYSA